MFYPYEGYRSMNQGQKDDLPSFYEKKKKKSKSRTKEQVSSIGQISKTRKKDPDTSGFI